MDEARGRVVACKVVEVVKEGLARVRLLERVVELAVVGVLVGIGIVARNDNGDNDHNDDDGGDAADDEGPDLLGPGHGFPPRPRVLLVVCATHVGGVVQAGRWR